MILLLLFFIFIIICLLLLYIDIELRKSAAYKAALLLPGKSMHPLIGNFIEVLFQSQGMYLHIYNNFK